VSTLDGGKSDRPKSKPKVQKNFPPPKTEYTSQALFFKHLVALEVKRFHYARRNKKGLCCEVNIPKSNWNEDYFSFNRNLMMYVPE
jgi:hypothetical protein